MAPLKGNFGHGKAQGQTLVSRYTLGEEIGRGASGLVYKALNIQTGGMVAIKQVTLRGVSKEQLNLLQQEINLLKLLTNPYIVEYIESFNTKDTLYIVMEFVENGSLSQIVKKFGRLNESLVGLYTLQVLEGLHFLHEQGVIHRDIKGANILISTGGKVKLADFGVATKLEATGLDTQANSVVGTPYWMAPEIIQMSGFTTASDIWSVGCTVVELISGAPPYYEMAPMSALFRIVHDPHPPLPPGISQPLTEFLLLCFKKDTAQRPNAMRLKTHHWLTRRHDATVVATDEMDVGPHSVASLTERSLEPSWPNAILTSVGGGGATPAAALPEHILPKEETIRAVEEILANGLSLRPTPRDTPRGDAAKGCTAIYGAISSVSSSDVPNSAIDADRAQTICSPTNPTGSAGAHASPRATGGVSSPTSSRPPNPGHRRTHSHGSSSSASSLGLNSHALTSHSISTISGCKDAYSNPHSFSHGGPNHGSPPERGERYPRPIIGSWRSNPYAGSTPQPEPGRSKNLIGDAYLEEMVAAAAAAQQRLDHGRSNVEAHLPGGDVLAVLAAYAERPEEQNSRSWGDLLGPQLKGSSASLSSSASELIVASNPPPFHVLLAQRLRTDWECPALGADDPSGELYDYRDPFETLPPVSLKPANGDEAATKQRERLRGHIQQLQKASQQKHEAAAMEACAQLLDIFSTEADGILPGSSMEAIEEGKEASDARSSVASSKPERNASRYGSESRANEAAVFMQEHGMLPVVHMLSSSDSMRANRKLLELLNAILQRGGVAVCETACLLGVIPAVLRFTEPHIPQGTRYEAARFIHTMCTRSVLTLQMFVACSGLPALVRLLLSPAESHELVLYSIDAMKSVLDMKGHSPRNDLCRTFVELGVLELLMQALHEINAKHPDHAERAAEIFLLFSCADTVVKAQIATRQVLPGLMRVIEKPKEYGPHVVLLLLRCIKHLCMGDASQMEALQRAKAVPTLVAMLRLNQEGGLPAEMRNQCVNALYLLCKISRSRQEEAAINGVLPPLQALIEQGSPLKQFALPIVCDIAKASKRARAELKHHHGVQFYLSLLSTEFWQEAALDALLVWLLDEGTYVAKGMETPQGIKALQGVMECGNNSFVNMLEPLRQIVYNSPPVNRALGKLDGTLGISPFVQSLVKRLSHPDALVRRLLLDIMTSLYEQHRSPKLLVERHRLKPVLLNIIEHDPGVLVQNVAGRLFRSFEAHDIL